MTSLIEQLLTKLGLRDEPNILEKTNELIRLLELRSINVPLQINEYGKIVICADIASSLMGIPFDKEQALKISALRKSQYASNKRMFEKLLDLNKLVGVNDICIQLNLNHVNKKATELIELYREVIFNEQSMDVDISHPQYATMAVFMACKLCKQKISKPKLLPFSNLRPSQWQQLEQKWEKFIAKHYKEATEKTVTQKGITNDNSLKNNDTDKDIRVDIEDYEKWKQRMLAMAQSKLQQQKYDAESLKQTYDSVDFDFTDIIDNMILGC